MENAALGDGRALLVLQLLQRRGAQLLEHFQRPRRQLRHAAVARVSCLCSAAAVTRLCAGAAVSVCSGAPPLSPLSSDADARTWRGGSRRARGQLWNLCVTPPPPARAASLSSSQSWPLSCVTATSNAWRLGTQRGASPASLFVLFFFVRSRDLTLPLTLQSR